MTITDLPDIDWSFGDILAKIRREAGLTGAELAELLQIAPRSIGNYERDVTLPKRRTVREWAEFCGYSDPDALVSVWESARESGWIYDHSPRLFDLPEQTWRIAS